MGWTCSLLTGGQSVWIPDHHRGFTCHVLLKTITKRCFYYCKSAGVKPRCRGYTGKGDDLHKHLIDLSLPQSSAQAYQTMLPPWWAGWLPALDVVVLFHLCRQLLLHWVCAGMSRKIGSKAVAREEDQECWTSTANVTQQFKHAI